MDESRKKEELSIAYLSALCAAGGISFDLQRHDDDSTDAIIKKLITLADGRKCESIIRVQLKSTSSSSQYHEDQTTVTYSLKVKNYNDLRLRATTPLILALFILPENKSEWIKWTEEELLLKGRMYWAEFSKAPETKNTEKVSIKIEKNNCVNSDELLKLLKKVAEET